MQSITTYFPALTPEQQQQFAALDALYRDWNSKINVISRKDIDNLYLHHVLHSLAIAKILRFRDGSTVVDVGTGGGFPGIPLAIMFPNVRFHLVDSIGKKVRVAQEVAAAVGLTNCSFAHARMEEVKDKYDFVVSRAVMALPELVKLVQKNIAREQHNALPNGLICLKGGELQTEMLAYKNRATLYAISEFFKEDYFKTKKAVYLPL